MAVRTGTQLKTDAASAEAALDTAITTPTMANIQAASAAYDALRLNARDSVPRISTNDKAAQSLARDVQSFANSARRELEHIMSTMSNSSAAELRAALQRIRNSMNVQGYANLTSKPTTT